MEGSAFFSKKCTSLLNYYIFTGELLGRKLKLKTNRSWNLKNNSDVNEK